MKPHEPLYGRVALRGHVHLLQSRLGGVEDGIVGTRHSVSMEALVTTEICRAEALT